MPARSRRPSRTRRPAAYYVERRSTSPWSIIGWAVVVMFVLMGLVTCGLVAVVAGG